MLKEVMMGAGGIMLAAAIFASSVTPSAVPGTQPTTPPAQTVVAAPTAAPATAPAPSPPPAPFPEDSGDSVFGAPMIEAVPVDSGGDAPQSPEPDSGTEEAGGRQYTSKPGRKYPVPR